MIYVVQQGDWLQGIAERFGFADYRTLYDHPENAGFKLLRPDPDVIFPGDELFIPDADPPAFDRATGARHTFRVKSLVTRLRVVLVADGGPLAYRLELDGEAHEGVTDGSSPIEHEVAMSVGSAELFAWPEEMPAADRTDEIAHRFTLALGHLDPVEEDSGVQARLHNLGFDLAGLPGENLVDFQRAYGLDVTGEADDATRARLLEEHDQP